MKPNLPPSVCRRNQHGSVAVEATAVVSILFWLILGAFVIGRLIWQYNVVRTATANAARYMAAAPWSDARQAFARQMIVNAASDAGLTGIQPDFTCTPLIYKNSCGDEGATTIVVTATLPVDDPTHLLIGHGKFVAAQSSARNAHVNKPDPS
jgi:Flp pilus assembly protein TadG